MTKIKQTKTKSYIRAKYTKDRRGLLLGKDGTVKTDDMERAVLLLFKTEANVHTS